MILSLTRTRRAPSRRRPLLTLLLTCLLAGLAAVLTAACGSTNATGDKGYVDGQGVITRLSPGERREPGPLVGTTLAGKQLRVAAHGKPVVINVWADWCAPCRAEAPLLKNAATTLRKDGVRFVGVAIRSSTANAQAFERHFAVPYPSLTDPDGTLLLAFHGTLTPNTIPSTVILDGKGRVAASVLGAVPSSMTLVDLVHDVMKQ